MLAIGRKILFVADYIGNCSEIIDWDKVVQQITNTEPSYVGPTHDVNTANVEGAYNVASAIRSAGHCLLSEGGSMGWGMYFPGKDFEMTVLTQFCKYVGLEESYFCWISSIKPGHMAPWHWDITDEYRTIGETKTVQRFHCHITDPQPGHFFVVDDHCFYNEYKGAIYKWPERSSWHAGSNAGLSTKFLFNVWGI